MKKVITIKQIEAECKGNKRSFNMLSAKQAFYLILGATEMLRERELEKPRTSEVESPSLSQLRKLTVKLYSR